MSGPLSGVKVLELAGVGPGPFCGMMLADMGADVLRIDRIAPSDIGLPLDPKFDFMARGRRSIALDLKTAPAVEIVMAVMEKADVLIEGFRPGVTERLGLGPDACLARNPRLIYGRVTGWGQHGPLAQSAGHDINYIAVSGALHAIGGAGQPPLPPLNLVGDYGGGAAGLWQDARGVNTLDGGAPWYGVYEAADGKYIAVGAIEGRFYRRLLECLDLDQASLPAQHDRTRWPELKEALGAAFKQKTRDEWCDLLAGCDVCFAPVLSLSEAPSHPHNRARETFTQRGGLVQPAPAPRFSRTVPRVERDAPRRGEGGVAALADWGFDPAEIARFRRSGAMLAQD